MYNTHQNMNKFYISQIICNSFAYRKQKVRKGIFATTRGNTFFLTQEQKFLFKDIS